MSEGSIKRGKLIVHNDCREQMQGVYSHSCTGISFTDTQSCDIIPQTIKMLSSTMEASIHFVINTHQENIHG